MTKQQASFKDPQEIFDAYIERLDDLVEGQSASVFQEMSKEFLRAWSDLTIQAVQHPQDWIDTLFHYQRDQMIQPIWTGRTRTNSNFTPVFSPTPCRPPILRQPILK